MRGDALISEHFMLSQASLVFCQVATQKDSPRQKSPGVIAQARACKGKRAVFALLLPDCGGVFIDGVDSDFTRRHPPAKRPPAADYAAAAKCLKLKPGAG
jgi:hypothetical protein